MANIFNFVKSGFKALPRFIISIPSHISKGFKALSASAVNISFWAAIRIGNKRIVNYLIKHGANVNYGAGEYDLPSRITRVVYWLATKIGTKSVVSGLKKREYDTGRGKLPSRVIMEKAEFNQDMLELLLEKGAEIDVREVQLVIRRNMGTPGLEEQARERNNKFLIALYNSGHANHLINACPNLDHDSQEIILDIFTQKFDYYNSPQNYDLHKKISTADQLIKIFPHLSKIFPHQHVDIQTSILERLCSCDSPNIIDTTVKMLHDMFVTSDNDDIKGLSLRYLFECLDFRRYSVPAAQTLEKLEMSSGMKKSFLYDLAARLVKNDLGFFDFDAYAILIEKLYHILLTDEDSEVKEVSLGVLSEILEKTRGLVGNEAIRQLAQVFSHTQDPDIKTFVLNNLIKLLDDHSLDVREAAIEQLYDIFSEIQDLETKARVLELLVAKSFNYTNDFFGKTAMKRLVKIFDTPENQKIREIQIILSKKLIEKLDDTDDRYYVRPKAVNLLGGTLPVIQDVEIQAVICQKLLDIINHGSNHNGVMQVAIYQLDKIFSVTGIQDIQTIVLEKLEDILKTEDPIMKKTATIVLGRIFSITQDQKHQEFILEKLIESLNERDAFFRLCAIEQIENVFPLISDQNTREFILEKIIGLRGEDPKVRRAIIDFLCRAFPTIENADIQKTIIQKLSDNLMDNQVSRAAYYALRHILFAPRFGAQDTVLKELINQRTDVDYRIRATAVQLLGEVFPAITEDQGDIFVRDLVLREILQASQDPEPAVRSSAIYALSRVFSYTPRFPLLAISDNAERMILEAFENSLSDEDTAVQDAALQALNRVFRAITPSAQISVLENLGKRLGDADGFVRTAASNQLVAVFHEIPADIQRIVATKLIDALENYRFPDQIPKVLEKIFLEIPPDFQQIALLRLGDRLMKNDPAALEALKKILLIQNDQETVLEELMSILKLDDDLVERLESIDDDVIERLDGVGVAIEILGKVFPAIPEGMQETVLQTLQSMREIHHPVLSKAADQALNQAEGIRDLYAEKSQQEEEVRSSYRR